MIARFLILDEPGDVVPCPHQAGGPHPWGTRDDRLELHQQPPDNLVRLDPGRGGGSGRR